MDLGTDQRLREQIATLEAYLRVKLDQKDWHGVRDCCVDIEILEAQLEAIEETKL